MRTTNQAFFELHYQHEPYKSRTMTHSSNDMTLKYLINFYKDGVLLNLSIS